MAKGPRKRKIYKHRITPGARAQIHDCSKPRRIVNPRTGKVSWEFVAGREAELEERRKR